ncbi:hypothetical protein YC2023_018434 [Brassica napus]
MGVEAYILVTLLGLDDERMVNEPQPPLVVWQTGSEMENLVSVESTTPRIDKPLNSLHAEDGERSFITFNIKYLVEKKVPHLYMGLTQGSHDYEPGQMHGQNRRSLRRANHKQGASLLWFELKWAPTLSSQHFRYYKKTISSTPSILSS